MTPIIMPQVGQDIPSAKIIEWMVDENDPVEEGDVVLVVESEKAAFDVEAEQSGVLLKRLHEAGEEVEVFGPVGYIGQEGEEVPEASGAPKPQVEGAASAVRPTQVAAKGPPTAASTHGRVFASPSARRVAAELGVEFATVRGTGPGGRIVKEDVQEHARGRGVATQPRAERPSGEVAPVVEADDIVEPFAKMRQRAADRLSWSKQNVPHFYITVDVDMTDALAWRTKHNWTGANKITVTDLIVKATASALREYPRMNAHVGPDRIVMKTRVNIGVATALPDGLLVPVIADTDKLSLSEISAQLRENTQAARRGSIRSAAVGTFTVSSLGMFGVREFTPVINPPECAILAAGAAQRRTVPSQKGVGLNVRTMMTLTLACDHRGVDGAYAATFLGQIKKNLEETA